jgi:cytoskeletal protein RodZ
MVTKRIGAIIGALAIVVAIIAVAAYFHNRHEQTATRHSSDHSQASSQQSNRTNDKQNSSTAVSSDKDENACTKLFTLADAQVLLGKGVKASDTSTESQANGTITTCTYSNGNQSTGVIAHLYKTHLGSQSNDVEFGSGRPKAAVSVSGYGDTAFWLKSTHTLSVLKKNNWYEVKGADLSHAEQAAKLLIMNVSK